jgi:hypothetical protein
MDMANNKNGVNKYLFILCDGYENTIFVSV